jgi:hypothetical protein
VPGCLGAIGIMIVAISSAIIPLKLITQPNIDYSDSTAFFVEGEETFGKLIAGAN